MSENCSRCYFVQQSDSMEAYEKMTLILTWLITPVNSLLMSFWSRLFSFTSSSAQRDVRSANYGSL